MTTKTAKNDIMAFLGLLRCELLVQSLAQNNNEDNDSGDDEERAVSGGYCAVSCLCSQLAFPAATSRRSRPATAPTRRRQLSPEKYRVRKIREHCKLKICEMLVGTNF